MKYFKSAGAPSDTSASNASDRLWPGEKFPRWRGWAFALRTPWRTYLRRGVDLASGMQGRGKRPRGEGRAQTQRTRAKTKHNEAPIAQLPRVRGCQPQGREFDPPWERATSANACRQKFFAQIWRWPRHCPNPQVWQRGAPPRHSDYKTQGRPTNFSNACPKKIGAMKNIGVANKQKPQR